VDFRESGNRNQKGLSYSQAEKKLHRLDVNRLLQCFRNNPALLTVEIYEKTRVLCGLLPGFSKKCSHGRRNVSGAAAVVHVP
jgi:hypothetical protein